MFGLVVLLSTSGSQKWYKTWGITRSSDFKSWPTSALIQRMTPLQPPPTLTGKPKGYVLPSGSLLGVKLIAQNEGSPGWKRFRRVSPATFCFANLPTAVMRCLQNVCSFTIRLQTFSLPNSLCAWPFFRTVQGQALPVKLYRAGNWVDISAFFWWPMFTPVSNGKRAFKLMSPHYATMRQ